MSLSPGQPDGPGRKKSIRRDGFWVAIGSGEGHRQAQDLATSGKPRVVTRVGLKPEPQRWSEANSSPLLSASPGCSRVCRG